MKQTEGRWSWQAHPLYFKVERFSQIKGLLQNGDPYPCSLFACDDIADKPERVADLFGKHSILLDSGCFNIANQYAQTKGIALRDAFRSRFEDIPNAHDAVMLWRRCVDVLRHGLWGYIEFDLGDKNQKRERRFRLEDEGYRPIPVWHAFSDDWDYFDELVSTYDRVCIGNMVRANREDRLTILVNIKTRMMGRPRCWIHTLGITPNDVFMSAPTESCDSSSWIDWIRFPASGFSTFESLRRADTFIRYMNYNDGESRFEKLKTLGRHDAARMMMVDVDLISKEDYA